MDVNLIFNDGYDIKVPSAAEVHSFDGEKFGRAMRALRAEIGDSAVDERVVEPEAEADLGSLSIVHSPEYLDRLKTSAEVAHVLETPMVEAFPAELVDQVILSPMRLACAGSVLAAELAREDGKFMINMSGGYHHAKFERGEGFCVYSDIALAVEKLRRSGLLGEGQTVAYIDLDAHQGNGVSHYYLDDDRVKMFDMFNEAAYPAHDTEARFRVDLAIPLTPGTSDDAYLGQLMEGLPRFLDGLSNVGLAIYNAGTDILDGDPVGGLGVSREGVLERDLFVFRTLQERSIPTVMLPSGGYTPESYELIASSIQAYLTQD